MPETEDRSTLVYALETLGPIRDEIERAPQATIKPREPGADEAGRRAIAALMEAAQRERTVTLGDTLGQGGMGVVHLAEQVALGRTVAVKRLRSEHEGDAHVLALMREAWVTGGLEHPNVVPVHDVGLDADGRPFLVMKRIEGEEWARLIAAPGDVRHRFQVGDVQAWHLGVLLQVCNAVAFAHSRGIIHRDLKPENVMIGAFGEVYLLDWGIAVTLKPDPSGRLPGVRQGSVAGTPAYMAPEMLGNEPLGTWTDVYLLGGLLYEVLTGRPPHQGGKLAELLASIERSTPEVPEGPSELVELAMAALSREREARPASAEAFRAALSRHIEHRGAIQLTRDASLALLRLEEGLSGEDPDRDELWHLFGEARFGFRQALRSWPDHHEAREGLERAVSAMVRSELASGDAPAAARLLAEDPVRDPALSEEVRHAVARAERLAVDRDRSVGQRTRWFVAVLLAVVWSLFPLFGWFQWFEADHRLTVQRDLAFAAMVLGLGFWARDSLSKTALNRSTFAVLLTVPLSQILLTLGAWRLGFTAQHLLPFYLFLWGVVAALVTVTLERRFWPTTSAYAIGFLVAAERPQDMLLVASLANFGLALNICVIWWPWGWPLSSRSAAPPSAPPAAPDAGG